MRFSRTVGTLGTVAVGAAVLASTVSAGGSALKGTISWNDVRQGFPDQKIKLFGPGTDSGTFDYFTEAIMGKQKASRADYQATEDDNVTVQGVSGEKGGLGYFGLSYY